MRITRRIRQRFQNPLTRESILKRLSQLSERKQARAAKKLLRPVPMELRRAGAVRSAEGL